MIPEGQRHSALGTPYTRREFQSQYKRLVNKSFIVDHLVDKSVIDGVNTIYYTENKNGVVSHRLPSDKWPSVRATITNSPGSGPFKAYGILGSGLGASDSLGFPRWLCLE